MMRIGQDMLDNPVPAIGIGIDQSVKEAVLLRIIDLMQQVAFLLVAERPAIGNEKLEIARVGLIDRRIINLVDDPVTQREPNAATRVIRRPDPFLGTVRPTRFNPRPAKGGGPIALLRCTHAWTAARRPFSRNRLWMKS